MPPLFPKPGYPGFLPPELIKEKNSIDANEGKQTGSIQKMEESEPGLRFF